MVSSLVEKSYWRFNFYLNEIKTVSSLSQILFSHVCRSANGLAGSLAEHAFCCSYWVICFGL